MQHNELANRRVSWRIQARLALRTIHLHIKMAQHQALMMHQGELRGPLLKRLGRTEARKLVQRVLNEASVAFSKHALQEMAKDEMTTVDVENVLRCGQIKTEAEGENGSWRYRLHTDRFCVVVAFRSSSQMVVVTAWRK